jgi:hypothetical protein
MEFLRVRPLARLSRVDLRLDHQASVDAVGPSVDPQVANKRMLGCSSH